jgi:hypothetical protein
MNIKVAKLKDVVGYVADKQVQWVGWKYSHLEYLKLNILLWIFV